MGPIPFAFSVHHFISSVGADAGFASIIGLAVLVLLYFAQARETTFLREQLTDAAQRVQQLETRLTQLGRGTPAPAPAPAPAPPPASASVWRQPQQPQPQPQAPAGAAAAAPATSRAVPAPVAAPTAGQPAGATAVADRAGAPAGVGAPALSAATRLIPGSVLAPQQPGEAPSVTPAPATAAGGGNGTAQPAPARAPAQAPPRIQMRPAAAPGAARRPELPPRLTPPRDAGSSRGRRVLIAVIALLALAAVVVVLLVLTSSQGGSTSATHSAPVSNAPVVHRHARTRTAGASGVTVAVLNGTATSGLAHRVAQKLSGGGYKQGTVATATDQTHTATVVAYMPGHQHDAMAVAATLKLGPASVAPLDQSTQAVACPPPAACNATVVVTVGSDLASIH